MQDVTFYTVMELAEKVGVPRTTINDWLSKFSSFIDFSMQGKRRVYSENTLTVLKKIQELRNTGLSIPEIERELARTCVMHPEAEPEQEQTVPAASQPQEQTAAAPQNNSNLPELASITREQTEQITQLLGDRLHCILEKMDTIEDKAHKNAIRSWFFFALASVLIIILCGAGYFAYLYSLRMEKESREKNNRLKQLQEQTVILKNGDDALKAEMEELQKQLPAQRKEFQKALEEMQKSAELRHQAELAREKDRFAAQALEYARERDALNQSVKVREQELQKQKQALEEMKKHAEELERTIQENRKKEAERQRMENEQKINKEAEKAKLEQKTVPAPVSPQPVPVNHPGAGQTVLQK